MSAAESATRVGSAGQAERAASEDGEEVLIIGDHDAEPQAAPSPSAGAEAAAGDRDLPPGVPDEDEQTVLIIDDGDAGTAASVGGEAHGAPEQGWPAAQASAGAATWGAQAGLSPAAGRTWLRTEIGSRLLIDRRFDRSGEDVMAWWNVGVLRLDYRAGPALRGVMEAWARWGVEGEDPGSEKPFLAANARDNRWTGEVDLREAYVAVRQGSFEVKVGQRIFVWGKNELMPPADVLNPLDLRYDPIAVLDAPKSVKAPVFAIDARYTRPRASVQLVVTPVFTPHRVFYVGHDFAVGAAATGAMTQILTEAISIHPSFEDELQQILERTLMPEESPLQASAALRVETHLRGWDLAGTAYYGWDRTVRLYVDPDLLVLAQQQQRLRAEPTLVLTDPELREATLGLQQKIGAGQELIRGVYRRMWVLAVEAEGVLGDYVLRADAGFVPGQIFYTSSGKPVVRPSARAVAGVETMRGDKWFLQVTGFSVVAFAAPADATLAGLEAHSVSPALRKNAVMYGVAVTGRYSWPDEHIQTSVTGLCNVVPGDRVASGKISYTGLEPHEISLGAVLLDGPAGTLGRLFAHNDFAFIEYKGVW